MKDASKLCPKCGKDVAAAIASGAAGRPACGHSSSSSSTSPGWRTEYSDRNLASLPIGLQTLAGVEFDVRGVIRTCSQPRRDFGRRFPPVINGLKINRKCQYLYFLEGTGWKAPDQYPVASYIIHYADGQQREINKMRPFTWRDVECWFRWP